MENPEEKIDEKKSNDKKDKDLNNSREINLDETYIGGIENNRGEKKLLATEKEKKDLKLVAPEDIEKQPEKFRVKSMRGRNLIETLSKSYTVGKEFSQYALDRMFIVKGKTYKEAKKSIDNNDIARVPDGYSKLKEIGLTDDVIGKKNLDKLMNGQETDLINVKLKKPGIEIKNLPPFTLKAVGREGEKTIKLTFKEPELNLERDKIGKELNEKEIQGIKKEGETIVKRDNDPAYKVKVNAKTNTLEKISLEETERNLQNPNKEVKFQPKKEYIPAPESVVKNLSEIDKKYLGQNKSIVKQGIEVPGRKGKFYGEISKDPEGNLVVETTRLEKMKTRSISKNEKDIEL